MLVSPRFLPLLCRVRETKDDYRLTLFTKIILRSFGYGLVRKPRIFQAHTQPTEHAPTWARLGVLACKALRGASDQGALGRASSFLDFPWLIRSQAISAMPASTIELLDRVCRATNLAR